MHVAIYTGTMLWTNLLLLRQPLRPRLHGRLDHSDV